MHNLRPKEVNSPSNFMSSSQFDFNRNLDRNVNSFTASTVIQTKNYSFGGGQNYYTHSNYTNESRNFNPKSSMMQSQLFQSTVRSILKGPPSVGEDRIASIAKGFLNIYGNKSSQISQQGMRAIQQEANSNRNFDQTQQTVAELFKVMDGNRDNRVTYDDILNLCKRYLNFEKRQIIYTPVVQQRLAVARRLFKEFDVEKKGYLTQKQVPTLLARTYSSLGKVFHATQEDVKSWMRLTDNDGDGHVTLPQYQRSIIRALKKQGIKIYQE